jgi:hypothetical protein
MSLRITDPEDPAGPPISFFIQQAFSVNGGTPTVSLSASENGFADFSTNLWIAYSGLLIDGANYRM